MWGKSYGWLLKHPNSKLELTVWLSDQKTVFLRKVHPVYTRELEPEVTLTAFQSPQAPLQRILQRLVGEPSLRDRGSTHVQWRRGGKITLMLQWGVGATLTALSCDKNISGNLINYTVFLGRSPF